MLKEIYEQPSSIENAMRGRFDEDEATADAACQRVRKESTLNESARKSSLCTVSPCGHAGTTVEVEVASPPSDVIMMLLLPPFQSLVLK